jgi:hypothetical protein
MSLQAIEGKWCFRPSRAGSQKSAAKRLHVAHGAMVSLEISNNLA